MVNKIVVFYLTVSIITCRCVAQEEVESSKVKIVEQTPAAPNTASLGKYFEVPVNMATGVPNIQIPIFTVQSGRISLPIALSYHSSGNKVNNPASWVGYGWDLMCGGVVTKQVNGLDDFYAKEQFPTQSGIDNPAVFEYMDNPNYSHEINDASLGFSDMTSIIDSLRFGQRSNHPGWQDSMYRMLGLITKGKYDGESDEYHFKTPQGGGTVYYNQKTMQLEANEINGWRVWFNLELNFWTIQDKNGLHYTFSARESSLSPYYSWPLSGVPAPQRVFTSAWYLTKVTDPASGKEVVLEYDFTSMEMQMDYITHSQDWTTAGGIPQLQSNNPRQVQRYSNQAALKRIIFEDGEVLFTRDSAARLDQGVNALKEISIFNSKGLLIKKIQLDYFYAWRGTANAARLFLKSVQEVRHSNHISSAIPPFSITYDTSSVMPPRFSYNQDIWGYNNGASSNTTDIPTTLEMTAVGIPAHANREINPSFTQTGIIKKIVYPTGGSLSFIFENNHIGTDQLVGGLRVKRIVNYDSLTGKSLTTEYKYIQPNGVSSGQVHYMPTFHYSVDIGQFGINHYRISGDPIYPLFNNQGSPVTYTQVEKNEVGSADTIKTRHFFYAGPTYVEQQIEWNYRNTDVGVPFNKYSDMQRFSYHPYKTEMFKRVQNGQYKQITRTTYDYSFLNNLKKYIWNTQTAWGKSNWGVFAEWNGWDTYQRVPMDPTTYINAYRIVQDNVINTAVSTETFDDMDSVMVENVKKTYDTLTGNIKQVTTISSKGDTLRNYITYAYDLSYTASSDPINQQINLLQDNNMVASPVEIIQTTRSPGSSEEVITSALLYLYENNQPRKVYTIKEPLLLSSFVRVYNNNTAFYRDSRYVLESEIESVNTARLPLQIKLREKTQALIWDNNELIASAVNAEATKIAATSFENYSKGNWQFSGTVRRDISAVTGNHVYELSSGNIASATLPAGNYTVSYWSKSGSKSANSTSGTAGHTINGWTLYKHLVTTAGGTITISGSGDIDELRLYPEAAMMTTYTYHSLIGMQSQCDQRDVVAYYVYDDFGRLAYVKDQDGMILKRICYNYASQPENCSVFYSASKSGTFARQSCDSGYGGSSVVYTVPDSVYFSVLSQAEADSMALADVYANGQRYADSIGNCLPLFYNVQKSGSFTRNNCGHAYTGSSVSYIVAAGTYSSAISQQYVDSSAQANVNTNGQAYANANGTCTLTCHSGNCSGTNKKCINGVCQTGVKVYTSWVYLGPHNYECTYHYEWSDGSWSPNYTEQSISPCYSES